MGSDSAVRIATGRHLEASAEGDIRLEVSGPGGCAGTLVLRSERPISSRWLERGRPRVVVLARAQFTLPAGGRAEVLLRLSPAHLALLRRMGTIRAVAHAVTADSHAAAAVTVRAHPRRRATGRAAARAAATGVLTLLVCTPAALASWSAPQTLSSQQATGTPALGIDARGDALATWARPFERGWRLASRPAGANAFGPQRAAPYLGDEVVDGGASRAARLRRRAGARARAAQGALDVRRARHPLRDRRSQRTPARRRPAPRDALLAPAAAAARVRRQPPRRRDRRLDRVPARRARPLRQDPRRGAQSGRPPAGSRLRRARHAASRRRVPDARGGRRRARRHARRHPPQGQSRDALARALGPLERAARADDRRPAGRRAARRDRPRRRRLAAVVERDAAASAP